MERNRLLTVVLAGLVGLSVLVAPCDARLVTVAVTAEVTEVRRGVVNLDGKVQVGDIITGTYTYDTAAENLWDGSDGWYEFSSAPCGMIFEVGGTPFRQTPIIFT